jgi:hypothetical protein
MQRRAERMAGCPARIFAINSKSDFLVARVIPVGLGAAGMFEPAVVAGAHGFKRIGGGGAIDDLFNDHTNARLPRSPRHGSLTLRPCCGGVVDLEVGYKWAGGIDDDVALIAALIETGEVSEFCMWCHGFGMLNVFGLRVAATTGSLPPSVCDDEYNLLTKDKKLPVELLTIGNGEEPWGLPTADR